MTDNVREVLGLKKKTREEFLAARKLTIGGSDIASVAGIGDFACSRRLGYDKLGMTPDFDSSDKPEFRRGNRLEPVAAAYYQEKTGRRVELVETVAVKGKPHLACNMDRLVWRENNDAPGYLEIKTVGKFSMTLIKKEGLYPAYIAQVHYGCFVAGLSWGSFAVYSPDDDELLFWDFEADKELGAKLAEEADDFWVLYIEGRVLPPPLPEIKKVCAGCDFRVTCRGVSEIHIEKTKRSKK